MELILALVAIAVTVIVVARLCEPLGLPVPIVLLGVGILAAFLPFIPQVTLEPEVVLIGLLPPLLYAAALNTSLTDITANRWPILMLSVGLVLFTALGVGLLVWWLLPVPFAIAFALGAVVAPPDAVAATALARRIGLPRRIVTILEGESLLNDATALVALRTAVAAAGLAVAGHGDGAHPAVTEVTVASVTLDFLVASLGGLAVGFAAFVAIALVRRRLTESAADTALSFVAPFVAFVPAELIGSSGVIAVVTTGLLLAHKAPFLQTAQSRLSERVNWRSITFLLENAVFLLIGLQAWLILEDLQNGTISAARTFTVGALVLVACIVLRPLWIVPFSWVRARYHGFDSSWVGSALVASWAGMRGVVTLAAALTLPAETPGRPSLVMIALMVTIGTLLLQSFTLPVLARALGIRGPDPREDALQEATVVQAATAAGLVAIEDDESAATVETLREQSRHRVNRVWERLGSLSGSAETPGEAYRRLRLQMIEAEREKLLKIRGVGQVDHEVLSGVLNALDAEETALGFADQRHERLRASTLLPPEQVAGACAHLAEESTVAVPDATDGCPDCLTMGERAWVHLRMCTQCGHVGCCDSSPNKHASRHHAATGHPVMRSLEAGEAWRWCFVDEALG